MSNAERLRGCNPVLVKKVLAVINDCASHGYTVRVIEGLRSAEDAAANWAKGRKRLANGKWVVVDPHAIVTKVQHSRHQDGEAADLAPFGQNNKPIWSTKCPAWECIGKSAKAHGLGGGYEWGWDLGHLEL